MYNLVFSASAAKYYKRCDTKTKRILNKCFSDLQSCPIVGPNIKRLRGELEGLYRYRSGNLRVVYKISLSEQIVYIVTIGSRGDVYK